MVFASLIAERVYHLAKMLPVTDATVTLEADEGLSGETRILVELKAGGSRLVAEDMDMEPGTALFKLLVRLERDVSCRAA